MELKDLIRQDSDRLFILDNECYIIFTGDSVQDEKPFIRIGNWINLPVELIPLIENIIITDLIAGNPSHEQFNIDINYLSTNRYIGSELIVKRYLDFQKAFGLDLTNAAIVDIEKDIPVVSRKKILSDQESFIGIFYTDGNFRITHKKNSIFSLKEVKENNLHSIRIHDLLSRQNRETVRYAGSGLVFLENNPLFYRKSLFTSYHFPKNYYQAFNRLRIDPAQIRDLILPSSNLMNISRILKWKHRSGGRMRIFSDHKEEMDLLSRLFSNATILRSNFQGMSFDTGEGLGIKNYPGTFNARLTYKKVKPTLKDISVAYIKGTGGLQTILKDELDALLVSYPVYEEANLLFKGTSTPLIILADSPSQAEKLAGSIPVVIRPGIQYEFLKYGSAENLIGDISLTITNMELPGLVNEKDVEKIPGAVRSFSYASPFDASKDILNITALMKTHLNTTVSRRFSASLAKTITEAGKMLRRDVFDSADSGGFRITLAFCGGALVQFAESLKSEKTAVTLSVLDEISDDRAESIASITDMQIRKYYEKILDDRRRMLELLKLFSRQPGAYKEIASLKEAIRKKKEHYQAEIPAARDTEVNKTLWRMRLKKTLKIILIPVILAAVVMAAYTGIRTFQRHQIAEKATAGKRQNEAIIKKYRVHIANTDIFTYVNQVAVKNGYAPLTYKSMQERSPDWIYPGNIFFMLDGEKVTVNPGDTLWGISRNKLLKRHLEFYKTIEEISAGPDKGKDMEKLIEKATALAFTGEQKALLRKKTGAKGK